MKIVVYDLPKGASLSKSSPAVKQADVVLLRHIAEGLWSVAKNTKGRIVTNVPFDGLPPDIKREVQL